MPAEWREASRDVPLNAAVIRDGARVLDGVDPLPDRDKTPAEWVWRQPAVTILSTTLPAPGREKNAVRGKASAKLSCRVAPGQTGEALFALIEEALTTKPTGGVKVTVKKLGGGDSWLYEPKGPAFPAADRAY
ncbi:MAG TPA: hypothetical protein DEF51_37660, partial [Myxococcales bacterium]|nr:hypothetical protein [Myxococcales bacterium]